MLEETEKAQGKGRRDLRELQSRFARDRERREPQETPWRRVLETSKKRRRFHEVLPKERSDLRRL